MKVTSRKKTMANGATSNGLRSRRALRGNFMGRTAWHEFHELA
jgi:hypothetical protein